MNTMTQPFKQLDHRIFSLLTLALTFSFTLGAFNNASSAQSPSQANPKHTDAFAKFVNPFLTRLCGDCHGEDSGDADFYVHDLDGRIRKGKDIERWEKILEMVSLGHMPPDSAPQPNRIDRDRVTGWITGELRAIGRGPDDSLLALPSQANRVNHEELFNGKHQGPAFTPSRVWRKSPHIYSRFANEMRTQVSQPLHGLGGKGIQDYASLLADESTIQTMLRNSNLVADQLMKGKRAPLSFLFQEGAEPEAKEIDRAVERLFQMIFQRQPTERDRARYVSGLFEKNREAAGLAVATRTLIVAMLMSPEFVFRLELGLGEIQADGRRMLGPMELAYAISFAFFDKPDPSLIKAAREGRLKTRADVEREVRRILDREDTKRAYHNYPMYHRWGADYYQHNPRVLRFFQEFFGYTGAPDVFKDRERNPDHHALRLRKDADLLVLSVLDRDKNVFEELLTTNRYPMDPLRHDQIDKALNDKNNRFYRGIRERMGDQDFESILRAGQWPGIQSNHVSAYNLVDARRESVRRQYRQPVAFPEHERAGMLTHPAWLVAHSGNFDNDPIRRGKWIREKLLADLVPDVPIGVDAKVPEDPHRTLKQRLDVVRTDECWRCHKLMNPLGEAFESFDDFGIYRDKIVVGDADAYRKALRKFHHDRKRTQQELSRWQSYDAAGRKKKAEEAKRNLQKLKRPTDTDAKNYKAQLRRFENDTKRWNNEYRKWSQMTDTDQQREIARHQDRLSKLKPPEGEFKPVDARGELRGTRDKNLDGKFDNAIELVHRLARSERVRQSFVRHAFRFWMGRNETLNDSPTLIAADRAYVESGGSFKELLVSLLTSDSFLYRKDIPNDESESENKNE